MRPICLDTQAGKREGKLRQLLCENDRCALAAHHADGDVLQLLARLHIGHAQLAVAPREPAIVIDAIVDTDALTIQRLLQIVDCIGMDTGGPGGFRLLGRHSRRCDDSSLSSR